MKAVRPRSENSRAESNFRGDGSWAVDRRTDHTSQRLVDRPQSTRDGDRDLVRERYGYRNATAGEISLRIRHGYLLCDED